MTFRFLPPAQAELVEGITYYAGINSELGARFEEAVAAALRLLVAHPERGAPRPAKLRRWLVKDFPFAIIYRASEVDVLIIAVAHQRKRPEYWQRRVE
jgi:plasmid stabilization system protein ParE